MEGPAAEARALVQEHDRTTSLRISVELLDRLMTLTGELTLIRNQSLLAADQDDGPLRPIVQRLDAVTWPRPLAELLETLFATYREHHPWVAEGPSPKSILREMLDMAHGRWLPRPDLDKMLAGVAESAAKKK
jgi:chemotaxis protein histidine kinase CheA